MRQLISYLLLVCVLLLRALSEPAQTLSVIYDFGSGGSQDPAQPSYSGMIAEGRDGNLYSAAPTLSNGGYGAAFTITPSGTLTVLYAFTPGASGINPRSGLVLGRDAKFYGTTPNG